MIIQRPAFSYKSGEKIELISNITMNHLGYLEFALCPLKDSKEFETEECFDQYPINLETGSRYVLPSPASGFYTVWGYLPQGLTCEHCVLRWQYTAGNNWGMCPDGQGRPGCGPQETFKTCSDIKIV